MRINGLRLLPAVVLACGMGAAQAQERPAYGTPIAAKQAKAVADAALAEARSNNWRVAVAIVDTHGMLRHFEMIDDTQTASVEVAINKARSAAGYRRSTKVFQDGINQGSASLLTLPGAIAVEGGLPIFEDGRVIGAIGVSGVTSEQDGVVAQAGVAAAAKAK